MIDKVIDFETAKILYTKDFKELINGCYQNFESNDGKKIGDFLPMTNINNQFGELFSAPTQSLLQKWLREIHGIHIILIPTITSSWTYKTITVISKRDNEVILGIKSVSDLPPYKEVCGYDFSTYEEALEVGLLTGLSLINKL